MPSVYLKNRVINHQNEIMKDFINRSHFAEIGIKDLNQTKVTDEEKQLLLSELLAFEKVVCDLKVLERLYYFISSLMIINDRPISEAVMYANAYRDIGLADFEANNSSNKVWEKGSTLFIRCAKQFGAYSVAAQLMEAHGTPCRESIFYRDRTDNKREFIKLMISLDRPSSFLLCFDSSDRTEVELEKRLQSSISLYNFG